MTGRPTATATATSSGGVGFLGLLTALLAAGKIFGFQDYSWWVVFSPIWGSLILVAVIVAVIMLGAWLLDQRDARRRRKRREAKRNNTAGVRKALDDYSKSIR